jgi:conjugative relaxase-like TrwC/TraI family protein
MMTANSLRADRGRNYATYLDGKTQTPERGDYYLGADGAPAESPGRWLTDPDALRRVGVTPGVVRPEELWALMAGHRPGQPEMFLRGAGADGTRAAGIDITFSAPKSVSIAWAFAGPELRAAIEAAQQAATWSALGRMRDTVALTTRYDPAIGGSVGALAEHLHAASFLHTTARGVGDEVPDPQLHNHVVITSIELHDGTTGAVRSRPAFRFAREGGAYYRAALAQELRELGFEIEPDGTDGRYFRIAGVSEETERAFSKRAVEVEQAARRFRAEHGRAPERGELRALAVRTRQQKAPQTRADLAAAWKQTAANAKHAPAPAIEAKRAMAELWPAAVESTVTARAAVFTAAELRTVALEQAAGHGLAPADALAQLEQLRDAGRVIELADGRLTTATVREAEQRIAEQMRAMAADGRRVIDAPACTTGIRIVERRLGGPLSAQQREAVELMSGPWRAVGVIGPAGTGKSVSIDAAAHAELAAGRQVYGLAVAGRTAQRLGESAPALAGRVKTIDGFAAAVEHGRLRVDDRTTVYVDEAGMGDTDRLAKVIDLVSERGGSVVLIGDAKQLPSIGAGGMFDRLTREIPTAELTEVRRTSDPDALAAWRALRDGDATTALDLFNRNGHLHLADTREQAVEQAIQRYDQLAAEHGHAQVAFVFDASNREIDHANLRQQHLRHDRGELSDTAVEHPDGFQLRVGDRVISSRPLMQEAGARVENGQRGEIIGLHPDTGRVAIRLDGEDRAAVIDRAQLDGLRLGYATHVVREQGATVRHSVVVTGGWQTSQETAYVEATRATHGTDWHIAREDLTDPDHDGLGDDAHALGQLAERMATSRAQEPSIATDTAPPSPLSVPLDDPGRLPGDPIGELHVSRLAAGTSYDLDHDADLGLELER